MATTIVELNLDHLDKGEFLNDMRKELEIVIRSFASHCRVYEASGTKAKLKVEIELEENESGVCVITTGFKKELPGKPKRKSNAMFDINDLDESTLFCQSSGADGGDPNQSEMFDPNDESNNES